MGVFRNFLQKIFFNALLQWCSPFTRTLGIFVNSQNIFKCKTEDPSQMLKKMISYYSITEVQLTIQRKYHSNGEKGRHLVVQTSRGTWAGKQAKLLSAGKGQKSTDYDNATVIGSVTSPRALMFVGRSVINY